MSIRKAATATAMCVAALGVAAGPANAAAGHVPAHHKTRHHHKGQAHAVSFTARVVRSTTKGLVVRTARGTVLSFAASQVKVARIHGKHRSHAHVRFHSADLSLSAGNVVVSLLGLEPGATIQITETTDAQGNVTITITLPGSTGEQTVSGVVGEVGDDVLTVSTADGIELRLHMSADTLSNLNLQSCDTVSATYHQDAGVLIADSITPTGSSSEGDCAPSYDATGAITDVSSDSITISTDGGPQTFAVDPSSGLTDGYQVGDLVDVTYSASPDGSQSASDVEFVEEETTGQVTSVTTSANGGSLTITDDDTGQPDVFVADPANGVQVNARAFNGISVGDGVDVTYHQSAGILIADTVSEQ